jgi:hypothetical protein
MHSSIGCRNPRSLARHSQAADEAFRVWFGDSKVVSFDGRPLVVYHGTQYDFDAFDPEMQGDTVYSGDVGFFFTNNPVEANGYATFDWDRESPVPNVMPVYLSLQNPLLIDIDNPNHPGESPATWYDEYGQDMARYAEDCGHDGLIISDFDGGVRQPTTSVSGKETVYVVFKNTQIKSSIGNFGTYDPDNPDIRCSNAARERSR